ncbi:cytochrome c oxidase assembly protein COX20, mitochondrial [Uranotaenia lowii]|uniref:cytochrome c oxidase assembly protein COX20, mitochondrial n=1 Tax=Uranotaenia lowii TaxID=190385 RepID=UPI00247ADA95|nr:cytochrome c oxidase assembly protein COX20, mitochondrial [Uranotaenia lowii]
MTSKKEIFQQMVPEDSLPQRGMVLFGKDVSQIPCFRNSFLYGISIGVAAGFLAFMRTSRPQMSCHIAFGTFFGTTLCYWFPCRYNWSKEAADAELLQKALQQQSMYEGTQAERDLDQKAKSA